MKIFNCLTVISVTLAAALNCNADPKVEEQVVGPTAKVMGIAISPHGTHLAALIPKGSRWAVTMDGVEGPKIDDFLGTGGGPSASAGLQPNLQIAFSDDGARYAYFAKMGDEYVVMVDGKEFARGKLSRETGPTGLKFSPGGKHLLYFIREMEGAITRAYVDGKAGPTNASQPEVAFSPDGMQYAYVGSELGKPQAKWAMVGERQVKYFGDNLQYTGTGHLIAQAVGSGFEALMLDGKPALQVADIQNLWVSKFSGGHVAAQVVPKPGAPSVLVVNGKAVPGTEGCQVRAVHFSPDGKRFAAECASQTFGKWFMVIDGKKGQEYQAVLNFQFTPDSTKAIYIARTSAGNFLVVEDEESDGYTNMSLDPVVIGGGGKRVGFIGWNTGPQMFVVVDGKVTERKGADALTFSPDGSRCAFQVYDGFTGALWLDGIEQPGFRIVRPQDGSPYPGVRFVMIPGVGAKRVYDGRGDAPLITFSPDNKHYAHVGAPPGKPAEKGFVLDGKLIPTGQYTGNHWMPRFSPDGQHLFCVYQIPGGNFRLDVDGKPAVTFGNDTLCTLAGNWDMSNDGVLTFVAVADGTLKRYRVSASPDTGLATLLASVTK